MARARIIRLGYFEHPSYVPLLRRSYELWRELEAERRPKLLHITGIAEIGPPGGEVVSGTLAASRLHGLPHEVMDAAETMRRFPAFRIPADYVGVFQPDGGFLAAEAGDRGDARAGAQRRARKSGPASRVSSVEPHGNGVRVETSDGDIEARTAIVAAGPWLRIAHPRPAGAAACHPRGDGLVRAARSGAVRWPAAFRCSCWKAATACTTASRHTRGGPGQDRQASPPRRDRRSRTTSIARFRRTTRR